MKKNRMMRLASFLLVCVLLTTSVISGTYAKYVTSAEAGDTARVAKWGVDFTTTSDLFKVEYAYDDTDFDAKGTLSVKSSNESNLVAPGTSGNAYSFTTTGTPEVSYIVTFEVTDFETVFLGGQSIFPTERYLPIKYTIDIGGNKQVIEGKLSATGIEYNVYVPSSCLAYLGDTLGKIAYYYDVDTQKYYYTTDYTATTVNWTEYGDTAPQMSISWEWPFENTYVDTKHTGDNFLAHQLTADDCDTLLGNLAAGVYPVLECAQEPHYPTSQLPNSDGVGLEVVLAITATATQID